MNILIIGYGIGAQIHLSQRENAKVELNIAVLLPMGSTSIDVALKDGFNVFNDFYEAVRVFRPDGVIITSPNKEHLTHVKYCVDEKLVCLVEKPMCSTLEEAYELVQYSQGFSDKILVGHHRAHSVYTKGAEQFVKSNLCGGLVGINGQAQFYKPSDYFVKGEWRTKLGGGPIAINLIHEIDFWRRVAGEIEGVFASSTNVNRGFDVEDTVAVIVNFCSGATGTFLLSDTVVSPFSWELTTGENSRYPILDEDCYVISGKNGSIKIPSMEYYSYPEHVEKSWWSELEKSKIEVLFEDPILIQLNHFIDIIVNGERPRVSILDGLKNQIVLNAIDQSIRTKSFIKIEC